jgi:hypothetical protein
LTIDAALRLWLERVAENPERGGLIGLLGFMLAKADLTPEEIEQVYRVALRSGKP